MQLQILALQLEADLSLRHYTPSQGNFFALLISMGPMDCMSAKTFLPWTKPRSDYTAVSQMLDSTKSQRLQGSHFFSTVIVPDFSLTSEKLP